ncbi:MAG: hypothetical protein ACW976_06350 [Candidatus Ranarchaeia archaeon]|jgi:hypothetical protein
MASKVFYLNFNIWIFVLSIIGGILFVFTEFAGYVTPPYSYVYLVSLESTFYNVDHLIYAPLFLLVGGLFFFNTFVAMKELEFIKIDLPFVNPQYGFFSAIGILAISAVGGVAFELIMAGSGAINWWLGTGFYAGLIGGILITILYYLLSKPQPTAN